MRPSDLQPDWSTGHIPDLGLASEVRGGGQSCGTDFVTCGIQVDSVKTELSVGHRVGGPELLGGGKNDQ